MLFLIRTIASLFIKIIRTCINFLLPSHALLNKKARKKIRYNQNGKKLGMTDIFKIYNELIKDKLETDGLLQKS
jgi:hypothetical protein